MHNYNHHQTQLQKQQKNIHDWVNSKRSVFNTWTCILYRAASISNLAINFFISLSSNVSYLFNFSSLSWIYFYTFLPWSHARIFSFEKSTGPINLFKLVTTTTTEIIIIYIWILYYIKIIVRITGTRIILWIILLQINLQNI